MLRRLLVAIALIALIGCLVSCTNPTGSDDYREVPTSHKIRVDNGMRKSVSITIGAARFDNIPANSTTSFKEIGEGKHNVTGDLEGYVVVSGRGRHKWELNIYRGGFTTISEVK